MRASVPAFGSMTLQRRLHAAALMFAVGLLAAIPAVAQAASREYDLKAAFLYNFATFGEWPPACFPKPSSPFVIGILGQDPFGATLDQIVAGDRIKGRPIVIKRFDRPTAADVCHILFISSSEKWHVREVLNLLRNRPVLTVADIPGFVEIGGSIGFTTNTRVGIQVNPAVLRSANLALSPKLLRLAEVVSVEPPP